MNAWVKNQAENRNTDDGQQNAARDFQFFQTDDHRKANQRHNNREAVEMTERNWQAIKWVFNYQADTVCGNQQQEQADTDTSTMRNTHR